MGNKNFRRSEHIKKIYEHIALNKDFSEYMGYGFIKQAYDKLIELNKEINKQKDKDKDALLEIFNPMEYIKSNKVFMDRWCFDGIKVVKN